MPPKQPKQHGGARKGSGRKQTNHAKGTPTLATIFHQKTAAAETGGSNDATIPAVAGGTVVNPYSEESKAARRKQEESEKALRRKREQDAKHRAEQEKKQQEEEAKRKDENRKGLYRLAQAAIAAIDGSGDDGGDEDGSDEDDEDDDDYEEDSDEDDDDDDEDDAGVLGGGAPNRMYGYKPPEGSFLYNEIKVFQNDIQSGLLRASVDQGQQEFPPCRTAASQTTAPTPEMSYAANTWNFVFFPFRSHKHHLKPLKDYECICCKKKGTLESAEYNYRLAFDWSQPKWLHHRRVRCAGKEGCRAQFAEIDPRFLSQLPTPVVEDLPFLTTTGGHAMNEMMVYHFMNLVTKGIMFATYTGSFNELYHLKHSKAHASYLDSAFDYQSSAKQYQEVDLMPPKPFAPFKSPGEYNGAKMSKRLLKALFYRVMELLEPYLQKSFQMRVDDGAVADHTFKYSNGIAAAGILSGKIFSASYTIMSLYGFINGNRPTYTKSNAEIKPFIEQYRQVRINSGKPRLMRYEGDGGGDNRLWSSIFKEDLSMGVTPFRPRTVNGMVRATIKDDRYLVLTTEGQVNNWALAGVDTVRKAKGIVFMGMDLEWNRSTQSLTRTMQLAFDGVDKVAVIHLSAMNAMTKDTFSEDLPALKTLLELPSIMPIGVNIAGDVARLRKQLGINITKMIDLGLLAQQHRADEAEGYGMRALCMRYLQLWVDKQGQDADYSETPLPTHLAEYAALDALLSLQLYHIISALLAQSPESQVGPLTAVSAELSFGNRVAAEVEIVFIGGRDGEQRKWGQLTIGKGKSLVKLRHVVIPSIKPSFSFVPSVEDQEQRIAGWKKEKMTLQELYQKEPNCLLAVHTDRLSINVAPVQQPAAINATSEGVEVHVAPGGSLGENHDEHSASDNAPTTNAPTPNVSTTHYEPMGDNHAANDDPAGVDPGDVDPSGILDPGNDDPGDDDDDDDDDDPGRGPRSRHKKDIMHEFQDLPIPHDSPIKNCVSRLVIHATFLFDEDDYQAVCDYLAQKKSITALEQVLRNFYFNREWWRRHVRMYTPPAKEHAARIRCILKFIQNESSLRPHVTSCRILEKLAEKCEKGDFEELGDVAMFTYAGKANGLALWWRNHGSTRAELGHQKMSTASGPWCIGARTGHYLLLLVSYRFNASTAIRRMNAHDFGHPWHHYLNQSQAVQSVHQLVGPQGE
jgi:hypothetical protein